MRNLLTRISFILIFAAGDIKFISISMKSPSITLIQHFSSTSIYFFGRQGHGITVISVMTCFLEMLMTV